LKNAVGYYNAGVVAVNYKIVGLGPGLVSDVCTLRMAPGLPDGLVSSQKSHLGTFLRALDWKMSIYFMAIWNLWLAFRIFYDRLVHVVLIGYIFPVLVSWHPCMTQQQKWTPGPTYLTSKAFFIVPAWCAHASHISFVSDFLKENLLASCHRLEGRAHPSSNL
jgi:hypothetical protein